MATYTADTPAKIHGYFNGTGGYAQAGIGDTIEIAVGTFDVDGLALGVLAPAAGVTVTGASVATTIVEATLATDPNDTTNTITFEDWTLDVTGLARAGATACCELKDCLFAATRWRVTGPGTITSKNLEFVADTNACVATLTDCEIDNAEDDCISTQGDSGTSAAASLLTLTDCEVHHCGSGGADQCLTAHGEVAVVDVGGYYHDCTSFLACVPAAGTDMTLTDTTVEGGQISPTTATGVTLTGAVGQNYGIWLGQTATITDCTATAANNATQWYGLYVSADGCVADNCDFAGWKRGIRHAAAGTLTLRDCTSTGNFNYGLWYYNASVAHVLQLEGRNEFTGNTTADVFFSLSGGSIALQFGVSDLKVDGTLDGTNPTITSSGGRMLAGTLANVSCTGRLIAWGCTDGGSNSQDVEFAPRQVGAMAMAS